MAGIVLDGEGVTDEERAAALARGRRGKARGIDAAHGRGEGAGGRREARPRAAVSGHRARATA